MNTRELDLSACHPYHYNTLTDKINAVPVIKTSAAFFTFLRANLVLDPSVMASNANTPQLEPWTSSRPGAPLTSPLAEEPLLVPMDDIPALYLETLKTEQDKIDGLHLIADSIAQMGQTASRSLVFHPACLSVLATALACVYRFSYRPHRDIGTAILVTCGVIATYLVAVRFVTSGYVNMAEQVRYSWLQNDDGAEDLVIGARFNNAIVGALVLRLKATQPLVPAGKKKSRGAGPKAVGQGVIRAWTTSLRYRGEGVGQDLLVEAVRVTKERCGKDAEIGFAKEHANSAMLLAELFNGSFRKQEQRATRALYDVVSQWEATKKKR